MPFGGPTGRVLVLDRNGNWQFDASIPDLVGKDITWQQGTPSGVFFVGTWPDQGGSQYRIAAYRLDGGGIVAVDSAEVPTTDSARAVLTPTGVDYPLAGDHVLTVDTGLPERTVSAVVDANRDRDITGAGRRRADRSAATDLDRRPGPRR
ncbi:MAG: hypothetical protein QM733_22050 [Ilumatobacteraceae bacterium]